MDLFAFPDVGFTVGSLSSLAICLFIVLTQRWHGAFTHDHTTGVQKFHSAPTPRVGGIALMAAFVVAVLISHHDWHSLLRPMLLAALPAFLFGLAEDITRKVGVMARLLATMTSGLLAAWIMDVSITRVEIPGVDMLLGYSFVSLAFTAFCVGGLANAINIIDGFNGLASGTVIIAFCAMGLIAYQVKDHELARLCIVLAGVTLGFMPVNFPMGKIFLGDGGAYLLGFMVAWVGVLLPMRNPEVSVWASFMAVGYPVIELTFSIVRRMRREHNPGHPDRLHLHSLVRSRIARRLKGVVPDPLVNASVSPFMWCYAVVPAGIAVLAFHSQAVLMLGLLASAVLYAVIYRRIIYFGWSWLRPASTQGDQVTSH